MVPVPAKLDNTPTSARQVMASYNRLRRRRRAFQRAMTGLSRNHRGPYRFLTLTSSPASPGDIQASWRKLHERMRRRGLIDAYIRVTEAGPSTGMVHIHIVFSGTWIPWQWLAHQWMEIHAASIHIRLARSHDRAGRVGLAQELSGFLAKDALARLSYSHTWAWRGLAWSWAWWVSAWRVSGASHRLGYINFIRLWEVCSARGHPPWREPRAMFALFPTPRLSTIVIP